MFFKSYLRACIFCLLFVALASSSVSAQTNLSVKLISSNFYGSINSAKFGRKVEVVVENNRDLRRILPGAKSLNFSKHRVIAVRIPDALLKVGAKKNITIDSAVAKARFTQINYTIFDVSPCGLSIPEFSTFMVVRVPKVAGSVKFKRYRSRSDENACIS